MNRVSIRTGIRTPLYVDIVVVLLTLGFLGAFLILPLVVVFGEAFRQGVAVWLKSVSDTDAFAAIRMTLLVAGISLPLNILFGLAAAWSLSKFRFKGRNLVVTMIDLPFAVSPVVSGLVFVLLFGAHGWLGPWLGRNNIQIIFAVPGIVIATLFVTFPYIARELIPLMTEQGNQEEQAALTLGAGGWKTFWRVTLPNIKWGLIYGVILSNARAMGEFGAVSIVSGHIRGETNTLPLHTEILYNEYQFTAAFAVASLLALLALVTIIFKSSIEWKMKEKLA